MYETTVGDAEARGGTWGTGWVSRLRDRVDTVPHGGGMFSRRTRRVGMGWVAVTVPSAVLVGSFVSGENAYLAGWVLLSGLCVTPALVFGAVLVRRLAGQCDLDFWRWWVAGVAGMYLVGVSVLGALLTGLVYFRIASTILGSASTLAFTVALFRLMRMRSGRRMLVVDVLEVMMVVTGAVALAVPLVAEPIVASPHAWFTIPASLAAVSLLYAFCWALLLFRRLGNGPRLVEAVGAIAAGVAVLGAAAQTAQGLSGFTLPAAPLFGLQVLCMGLLMMTPLCRMKTAPSGLDRLPPHAQVRSGWVDSVLVVGMLLALLVEVWMVGASVPWGQGFFAGVAFVQLVLLSLRYHLVSRETRRLYERIQIAAEDRRRLLADLVRTADVDRHRIAAHLHEQASASYVAFSSYLRVDPRDGADGAGELTGSLAALRAELAEQADSLRHLMAATAPSRPAGMASRRLTPPIAAYLDSLYGDGPVPTVVVDVDDDLEFDWVAETIVLRVAQEALRMVWRDAGATHIRVAVALEGDGLVVRIADDGRTRQPLDDDPQLETVRSCATLCGGSVEFAACDRGGGELVVRLGSGRARPPRPGSGHGSRPSGVPSFDRNRRAHSDRHGGHLRLVADDGTR